MTRDEARERNVEWLVTSAEEALASAAAEQAAGRARFALNRAYYACFYAASAVLLSEGQSFVKHTGVRAAVRGHLVKTARIAAELGSVFDELFEDRHEADYGMLVEFDPAIVAQRVAGAREFVNEMRRLLGKC